MCKTPLSGLPKCGDVGASLDAVRAQKRNGKGKGRGGVHA